MTKKELCRSVAKKATITLSDASVAIDVLGEAIAEAIVAGEEVNIPGLGKFSAKDVAEKSGVIAMGPSKGTAYVTPAHRIPKFRPCQALKDAMR